MSRWLPLVVYILAASSAVGQSSGGNHGGSGASGDLSTIGLTATTNICFVSSSGPYATISACMTHLSANGLNGGTIYSDVPEDFSPGYFALSNFHGLVILGHSKTNGGQCSQVAAFTCWMTQGPLVLPSWLHLSGVQVGQRFTFTNLAAASIISFDNTYPSSLGAPAAPTLACSNTGGSLSNGTYGVVITENNNLLGNTNNASAQATPGYSAASTEATVTCSGGTATQSITFTAPAQLTSSNTAFNAVDFQVYARCTATCTVVPDDQQLTSVATTTQPTPNLTCPGATGIVDVQGCSTFSGTVTVKNVLSAITSNVMAPTYRDASFVVDASNPLVVLGVGTPSIATNTFDTQLINLGLDGSPTGNNAALSNEPMMALLNINGQENSGADNIAISGSWGGTAVSGTSYGLSIYTPWKSGNSFLRNINIPTNNGSNTGVYAGIIVDGRAGSNGGARILDNASLAGSGNGGNPVVPYELLITGGAAALTVVGVHIESLGDGVKVDNLGSANLQLDSSTVPLNCTSDTFTKCASVHLTATADHVIGWVGKQGDTHPAFIDEGLGNYSVTPGLGFGAGYTNITTLGKLNSQFLLGSVVAPTISSGFGTSPSIQTNNGTFSFTVNVGTGGTATSGVIGFPTAHLGWIVNCVDFSTASATVFVTKQTAISSTSATIANFNTSGAQAAWAASDVLNCTAVAR